jgi:hypothetical protein
MDGQTKFLKIAELKRELHADECSDDRGLAILAEIRKIESAGKVKKTRAPKKEKERYMTVMGHYVLDMSNHGQLVGTRDEHGNIQDRHGVVIGH